MNDAKCPNGFTKATNWIGIGYYNIHNESLKNMGKQIEDEYREKSVLNNFVVKELNVKSTDSNT